VVGIGNTCLAAGGGQGASGCWGAGTDQKNRTEP
jgi:hypothetical protein